MEAKATKPAPPFVEKYEAYEADDGCYWVRVVTGWEDEDGKLNGRREVNIIPIRFASDIGNAAKDFAWMLNKARAERLAEGHYKPVT